MDMKDLLAIAEQALAEDFATEGGDKSTTQYSFNQTKTMGDATLNINATASDMEQLHQLLQMAGIDPSIADKHMEPEAPCGCDEPEEPQGPTTLNYRYETDKEKLIDIIKQRLQQKLS